jgi:hypothetical protein
MSWVNVQTCLKNVMSYLSEHVLKTLNIQEKPSCIFNCDETGVYFIAFKTLKCMLYYINNYIIKYV